MAKFNFVIMNDLLQNISKKLSKETNVVALERGNIRKRFSLSNSEHSNMEYVNVNQDMLSMEMVMKLSSFMRECNFRVNEI